MKLQLLSDLHLETEDFRPRPAPGAEVLVLGGDIDATWAAYERFAGWPVPVVVVAGNHEFDGRELTTAWPRFRERIGALGFTLLERESTVLSGRDGRRVRFVGTVRWCDFDLYGADKRERNMRAAGYFLRLMGATRGGRPLDATELRAESLACRAWLEAELAVPARGRWDATVALTHFGPSAASADPRYGLTPATASFANADDDLIPRADLWLHGHLHCRHDYRIARPGRPPARVLCNARGMDGKGESAGYDGGFTAEV
ncbi:MAG TPA: metallophosphoesterase [Rubrivivax sp.]|nr:metallophosphoesterase [Pseudomonadota bacterium]HOL37222.1 metallophosphoesterase [Rubrivivax sp.]HPP82824.1 metallophosphoesterase [Rubrivivax sp.]